MQECGLNSLVDNFSVKTPWYVRGKSDNKEGYLSWAHPFPRALESKRWSDITKVMVYSIEMLRVLVIRDIVFDELPSLQIHHKSHQDINPPKEIFDTTTLVEND